MKTKAILIVLILGLFTGNSFAQLGIKAGVNMANELHSFDSEAIAAGFQSDNLTGYHIGLVYQLNPRRTGFGFDVGALLSQKGGTFNMPSSDIIGSVIKGYHEVNFIEMPVNLRFRVRLGGAVGLFATGGVYGAYALKGKTVFESDVATLLHEESFDKMMDRLDYGYSYGGGIEFMRKIQIGVNFSQGLQKRDANKSLVDKITSESGGFVPNLQVQNTSKVFSVSLTYLLW